MPKPKYRIHSGPVFLNRPLSRYVLMETVQRVLFNLVKTEN